MWFANMKKFVYMAHTIPSVFTQKTDKFRFLAVLKSLAGDTAVFEVLMYMYLVHKPFKNGFIRKCVPAFTISFLI